MLEDLRLAPLAEDATIEPPLLSPLSLFPSIWTDQLPSLSESLWHASSSRSGDAPLSVTEAPRNPPTSSRPIANSQEVRHEATTSHEVDPTTSPEKHQRTGVAPLAVVLNHQPHSADVQAPACKRRRLDDISTGRYFELPRPNISSVEPQQHPWIPPLLQGLHEPPPDAGIFPPITDNRFAFHEDQALCALPTPTPTKTSFTEQFPPSSSATETRSDAQAPAPPIPLPSTLSLTTNSVATLSSPVENPEDSTLPSKKPTAPEPSRKRRTQHKPHRSKWTSAETSCLLKGVSKHGIGRWKQILHDTSLTFHGRTTVDLKDRFRTCQTAARPKSPTSKSLEDTSRSPRASRSPRKGRCQRDEEPQQLDMPKAFPPSKRRARTLFTPDEDERLLRGFEKYGTSWRRLADDAEFKLAHRRPKDLRDRMRNQFKDVLKRAKGAI